MPINRKIEMQPMELQPKKETKPFKKKRPKRCVVCHKHHKGACRQEVSK